ncbi:MAG: efflux RND transporter periplasmic adaptor subunit [Pseudomonadota bacterium]
MNDRTACILLVALATISTPVTGANSVCITESYKDAILSFTVPGRITRIHYRAGAVVSNGDIIVDLENRVESLEVERRRLIWEDKSDLKAAEAQRDTFSELLASTQGLYESTGSVSREELSRAELEFNSADAEYSRLLISEQREKVEYQLAQASLAQRSLKAPFDGTVVEVSQDEGEISEAYEPIVQIVDVSQGFLVCNVEEATGRHLNSGDELSFDIPKGAQTLSGQALVEYVSPVVDPASGLLKVRLRFDNDAGQIRPGVPGYVTIPEPSVAVTDG